MSLALVTSSLAEQEEIIERNLSAGFAVANALRRIREEELYREAGFDGFVEYLESKPWEIGRAQAYNMIETSVVSSTLEIEVPQRQARELAPLLRKATPEVVKQIYAEVVEETEGKPTAKKIREKVRKVLKKKKTPKKRPLTVDLRPQGLLETVTAIEELTRALVLIRGNGSAPADQVEDAVGKLEWIVEETAETLRVLREEQR